MKPTGGIFSLSLAVALAAVAEVATNAFVIAEADGIRAVDETTFHVSGGGRVRATTRSGWRFAKGNARSASFLLGASGYQHEVRSDLGEDDEEITYEDCTLSVSNGDEHVSSPEIAVAVDDERRLFAYALPATGVYVSVSADVDVNREAVHNEVVKHIPCPVCGQGPSDTERTPYTKSLSSFTWTAVGPNKTVASSTWSGFVPSGDGTVDFHVVGLNDCGACRCEADGSVPFTVHRLAISRRDWVGLDRTDAGRTYVSQRSFPGVALLDPSAANVTYSWISCGICKFDGGTDGQTVHYCATNSEMRSSSYLDQPLTVEATITDTASGQSVSVSCTTNFTVVKVDVQVDGVAEEDEETQGAELAYMPNALDGGLTEGGKSALVGVSIDVYPKNLPADDTVTITVPSGFLYVRDGEGYAPAASSYTVDELKTKSFYLHGHTVSSSPRDKEIEVVHDASGARDKAKFTVGEYKFTVYVDQPISGSNAFIAIEIITNLNGSVSNNYNVGHAFWGFSCSIPDTIPLWARSRANATAGLYADPPIPPYLEDLTNNVFAKYESPDTRHMDGVDVSKTWYLTKSSFLSGMTYIEGLDGDCRNHERRYGLTLYNCVNAVIDVARSVGIQLPENPIHLKIRVGDRVYDMTFLNAGRFGEDLKTMSEN